MSEDIVQPAMFWGPLAAGAARARRRPAHSFPVKKQQNISVIKLKDSATSVARSRRQRRSYDDLSTQRAHARSGDGTDALRNTRTCIPGDAGGRSMSEIPSRTGGTQGQTPQCSAAAVPPQIFVLDYPPG